MVDVGKQSNVTHFMICGTFHDLWTWWLYGSALPSVTMITRNVKTILFASLIATLILPFSMTNFADAGKENEQRIDAKKENIDRVRGDIEAMTKEISGLRTELTGLAEQGPIDFADLERISKALDARNASMERLQETSYQLFDIPDTRHEKLVEIKQDIIEKFKGTGIIDDVFIDHYDESIQIILKYDYFESHKNDVKNNSKTIATANSTFVEIGDVKVGVKYFVPSAEAGDAICAELGMESADRLTTCQNGTIAFPASKGSDSGFVTVGHIFRQGLSSSPGNPTQQLSVYQPGPSTNDEGEVEIPDGQTMANYANQIIGHLEYGVYGGQPNPNRDYAFVDLDDNEAIDSTVNLYGNTYDLVSYASYDPTIGDPVYKNGVTTGSSSGHVRYVGNSYAYASYTQCPGDSGSPVVATASGGYTVHGIHLGVAGDSEYFDQPDCSQSDNYSKFALYEDIAQDLGVTGTTTSAQSTVTGTVYYDINRNGVKDSAESGISGYTMHAIDVTTGGIRSTVTDADGTYTFENIKNGPSSTLIQTGYFPSQTIEPIGGWHTTVAPERGTTITFDVGFRVALPSEYVTLGFLEII